MTTSSNVRLLGIVGSLRRGSLNRGLMNAAGALLPDGAQLTVFETLADIPPYDSDVEAKGLPPSVVAFKDAIAAADGLLIVTPEYNYGIPGQLKNAIDWASRPANASPLRGKPVGIAGASMGAMGTVRAQMALRQTLVFLDMPAMMQPEVVIAKAHEKFDANLQLTDEPTREHLRKYVAALVAWVARLKK